MSHDRHLYRYCVNKWLIHLKMKRWQHSITAIVANEKKENTTGVTPYKFDKRVVDPKILGT